MVSQIRILLLLKRLHNILIVNLCDFLIIPLLHNVTFSKIVIHFVFNLLQLFFRIFFLIIVKILKLFQQGFFVSLLEVNGVFSINHNGIFAGELVVRVVVHNRRIHTCLIIIRKHQIIRNLFIIHKFFIVVVEVAVFDQIIPRHPILRIML